jgi:hypothetical protein
MADFDAMMKGHSMLMDGLDRFRDGMKRLSTNRAISQAQDEVNQLSGMEMDEMMKRQQMNAISQNLTMRLSGIGADPTQIAQVTGAIKPAAINSAEDAYLQGQVTGSKQLQGIGMNALNFGDIPKSRDRANSMAIAQLNADTQLQAAGIKGAGKNKFIQNLDTAQGKMFAKEIESVDQLQTGINDVDEALRALHQYGKGTFNLGTGPMATLGGLTKHVSGDTDRLNSQFKKINLGNMVRTFGGMSRAIDTDTERKAWEATQGDVNLDDKTNAEVLYGQKSLMLKHLYELKQKAEYVNQNDTLRGYKSNLSQVISVLSPKGEMTLIPKKAFGDYAKKGYQTVDKFVSNSWGKVAPAGGIDDGLEGEQDSKTPAGRKKSYGHLQD